MYEDTTAIVVESNGGNETVYDGFTSITMPRDGHRFAHVVYEEKANGVINLDNVVSIRPQS